MPEQQNTPITTSGPKYEIDESQRVMTRKPVITCISIGQGGYNGMRAMLDKPFVLPENCFVMNYKTDLTSAKLVDVRNHININDSSFGCGKNRDKAKNDAIQGMNMWLPELQSKINPKTDKIFVFVSSGGGLGSGAGPTVSAILSQPTFTEGIKGIAKRKIPVEVIMFKPALSNAQEEWENYSECLKEFSNIVDAKGISLYIADLSSADAVEGVTDKTTPEEKALIVDKEVAELLYRYECIEYLGNDTNLDFEDRYVISCTPKMRALARLKDGAFSSPFVLPKGELVNRGAFECSEEEVKVVNAMSKTLGITISDNSFKGVYPNSSESLSAYGFVMYSGFNVPEPTLKESQNVVSDLRRKSEAQERSDKSKIGQSYDTALAKENKRAIKEANSANALDMNAILKLVDSEE